MSVRAVCLLLLFAAAPAAAQDAGAPISIPGGGPPPPAPPPGPPPLQLFISPAGEPFRAEPGQPYPVALWFNQADANHDGVLSREEFVADSLAFFDKIDTSKDRVIDGFESADYERDVAPEITGLMARRERRGDGGPPPRDFPPSRTEQVMGPPSFFHPRGTPTMVRRQGAAQYGLLNEPQPVRGADSDLDQRVSRAEAEAAARRRFALLDQDGDGRIMLADLPTTPAQSMAGNRPEDRRRKKPAKRVEMPLQPRPSNDIEVAAPAVLSGSEIP